MNLRIASRFGTKDVGVCCVELSIRDRMLTMPYSISTLLTRNLQEVCELKQAMAELQEGTFIKHR